MKARVGHLLLGSCRQSEPVRTGEDVRCWPAAGLGVQPCKGEALGEVRWGLCGLGGGL